ncbi:protein SLX4IP isoform X2 [Agelaius phoeniceus]|uniref:protein SLX4IP isoform X2 n=2 Tax=Agelaius phoeniceus TaxID=39638 RepID=UPI0023ED54FC|nr:protein SLX4IP isoform X1 [Agelaius phoeniceus]XP_054484895.1 protein SLX4IP isoform X1 [Agelaius phoeniceus]XP_054484896.1 protein SLX4IP isoform X1 [Agelaius phoeniceus]
MASNKFVIKCGNFAVLVDVHILPQGSSKDTSWFSDHEKEEVCKLLEEVVASRVKHYLEAPKQRGQWKPMEQGSSGPLFLTANSLHITAYFMKRWVNLRCALGKRYRELRVFPEKFIVCVSKLDFDPSAWTCDSGELQKEELSNGTSEYFTESAENKKLKISLSEQIKQDILRKIVKRTKPRRSSASKPQISKDSKKVCLGWADLQTENRDSDCGPSLSARCAVKRRSPGLLKDCTNTAESSLGLPVLEQRKDVHQGQPEEVHSQHKPRSLEQPEARLLSESPPCGSESAPPAPKQSQRVTRAQAQLRTSGSQEELEHFTKVSSEGTPLTSINTEMSEREDNCLGPFLEETAPLNSRLFSKQDVTETMVDKKSLTLRKNPSRSLFVSSSGVQTSQNEPSTAPEELPAVPTSCLELHPVSSEKLSQKRKKEVENGLRKLKLRRLKKSKSEILP